MKQRNGCNYGSKVHKLGSNLSIYNYAGWWLSPTPLKNDGVSNSWDDDIPKQNGQIIQMFQTTNQLWF